MAATNWTQRHDCAGSLTPLHIFCCCQPKPRHVPFCALKSNMSNMNIVQATLDKLAGLLAIARPGRASSWQNASWGPCASLLASLVTEFALKEACCREVTTHQGVSACHNTRASRSLAERQQPLPPNVLLLRGGCKHNRDSQLARGVEIVRQPHPWTTLGATRDATQRRRCWEGCGSGGGSCTLVEG